MTTPTPVPDFFDQGLPEGDLFHYTSSDGLKGMVSGKCIWATNIEYLNDTTEFRHGENVIKKAMADRKRRANKVEKVFFDELKNMPTIFEPEDVFVVSLSEDGDLLSQWRGYTPSSCGFNVAFDPEALREAAWELDRMQLVRCIYDEKKQKAFALDLLDAYLKEFVSSSTAGEHEISFQQGLIASFKVRSTFAAAVMKHHSFAEEKEWRLLGVCRELPRFQFRAGKSCLTPYVELKWGGGTKLPVAQPVRAVAVGPCPDPGLSIKSVWQLLKVSQIGGVDVRGSQIPFKLW